MSPATGVDPGAGLVLLHPASFATAGISRALAAEAVTARVVDSPGVLDARTGGGATVLVLDPPSRGLYDGAALDRFVAAGGAVVALGAPGEADVPAALRDRPLDAWVPAPHGPRHLLLALRGALKTSALRQQAARARQEAARHQREIAELTEIGTALSTEHDQEKLLELILAQARRLTASDAGSLYLAEESEEGGRRLRFKLAQNHSRPELAFSEFTIPIDRSSLAGYVASTGELLSIEDAYALAPDAPYAINSSFDDRHGYRTRSVLAIPMKDHKHEIIGVLQLINRKRRSGVLLERPEDFAAEVIPYSLDTAERVSALASQAAVSIENSQLYDSIGRLFEGFVTAAVTAIEQRDPTTSGHSLRVATMTVGLAETVAKVATGPYRELDFSREQIKELRYAGLLHDFGKVGVREQVLVKAKKLYPLELELIRQRTAYVRRDAEKELYRRRMEHLERHGRDGYEALVARLEAGHRQHLETLETLMRLVREANEPAVMEREDSGELLRLGRDRYDDVDGRPRTYLTDREIQCLTIRRGSLDDRERLEIESHVEHTYRFLRQIPWTKELRQIPAIAYGHHEKLNGLGYPRQVRGWQIPVQTRMMTIADIFDALTASDRPYKEAVSAERALDIMSGEVEGNMLDRDLFEVFVEAGVYRQDRRDQR